ncbi:MAG: hypothetical protein ACOC6S_03325 [Chloroflexota bacterium]
MTASTKKTKKARSSQLSDKARIDWFWLLRRNYQRGQIQGFSRQVRALERHIRKLETLVPIESGYDPAIYSQCQEELATLKKWLTLAKVWG